MDNLQLLKDFHQKHQIDSPHYATGFASGVTDGITVCSCNARWHTYYSHVGLKWSALNAQCAAHDEAADALPQCATCGETLSLEPHLTADCGIAYTVMCGNCG